MIQANRLTTILEIAESKGLSTGVISTARITHAVEDVQIFVVGPKVHLFHGVQEQSYIFHVMKDAFGF